MAKTEISGYELSRNWFDWCFENPDLISPTHTAMYFFIIEHCNRLGWKEKFGLPMEMTKDAIGIKNYRTYSNTLTDLIDWGFIKLIQKSKNQYSSCIIAIVLNTKAHTKALDKALQKHSQKQYIDTVCINKQELLTIEPIKPINNTVYSFDDFWNIYNKKTDKPKCELKWKRLTEKEKAAIMETVPLYVQSTPDVQYRKNPLTYLNGKCWTDEIIQRGPAKLSPPNFNPSYEKWDGKKRWSGSQEIPYNAPPKPSNVERWDNEKQKWTFSNF